MHPPISQPDSQTLALFDRETESLLSMADNKEVQLGIHAARCLELLMDEQGEFVSNDTILNTCWRDHGVEVSDTSVRQVIAVLRRALATLNIDKKILLNAPGSGYSLAVNVIARKVTPPADLLPVDSSPRLTEEAAPVELPSKSNVRFYIGVSALSLALCAVVVFFQYHALFRTVEYQFIKQENDLILYSQKNYQPEINTLERIMAYQHAGFITLPQPAYIYLNSSWNSDNLSAFICAMPIDRENARCQSLVINGDEQ